MNRPYTVSRMGRTTHVFLPGGVRLYAARGGSRATYFAKLPRGFLGITLWRRGAVSLLAPIGKTGVPVQVVFGDWWRAG